MTFTPFAPPKLKTGDHIRILSPSSSVARIGGFEQNLIAKERLEILGFKVSFSDNYSENDIFGSASIKSRVDDIHEAFADNSVQAILATIGGFNSNELLPYLDYELIKNNPKIFCGYSDTTAVLTAIFAKTGMMTYYGASYSSFKMNELQDYQTACWLDAMTKSAYELRPSQYWSSDEWFLPNAKRDFFDTEWKVHTHGCATGRAIGGNLATFPLLNGTPFAPDLTTLGDYVLFLEGSESHDYMNIARQLTATLQAYPTPKAVLFGRFPKECRLTDECWQAILAKHPILSQVPVLYDLDFAHTQPLFSFTLGASVAVDTDKLTIWVDE